jgi:hypothetical protein
MPLILLASNTFQLQKIVGRKRASQDELDRAHSSHPTCAVKLWLLCALSSIHIPSRETYKFVQRRASQRKADSQAHSCMKYQGRTLTRKVLQCMSKSRLENEKRRYCHTCRKAGERLTCGVQDTSKPASDLHRNPPSVCKLKQEKQMKSEL